MLKISSRYLSKFYDVDAAVLDVVTNMIGAYFGGALEYDETLSLPKESNIGLSLNYFRSFPHGWEDHLYFLMMGLKEHSDLNAAMLAAPNDSFTVTDARTFHNALIRETTTHVLVSADLWQVLTPTRRPPVPYESMTIDNVCYVPEFCPPWIGTVLPPNTLVELDGPTRYNYNEPTFERNDTRHPTKSNTTHRRMEILFSSRFEYNNPRVVTLRVRP